MKIAARLLAALAVAYSLGSPTAHGGLASALESTDGIKWSRPVSIATTSVEARPALVVDRQDRVQVFYIDRDAGPASGYPGVVRWITAVPDGRIISDSRSVGAADLRARSLAAAIDGGEIRVAWIAPAGERMQVVFAQISGNVVGPVEPFAPAAEDAGPIALSSSGTGTHAAWSQASEGRRQVWYRDPRRGPALIAAGDAPSLSLGPAGPAVVWWQRAGFDAYRLVTAAPSGSVSPSIQPLTGNLATSRLQPPAVAHDAAGRLFVVFGTELRAFGPSVGRLFLLELGPDGVASPRRPVAADSPSASSAAAASWHNTAVFAWTDLRSGRSRNPEIYVGVPESGALREHRLTYTLGASALPVLAAGPDGALVAVWLEVTSGGRYALYLASTARPARQRFLLGIPELDVYRPAEAGAYALSALLGALPYAAMLALATLLMTVAVAALGSRVFGEMRWWAWLMDSGSRAAVAALALTFGLQATAVAAIFPFLPRLPPILAAGVLAVVWAWTRLRRGAPLTFVGRVALVFIVVFGVSTGLAFTWTARTLTRLAT